MGAQLIYATLLLYYAYQQPDTPKWAKTTIIGALGYLLSPIDAIPDLTPFLGFTDDLGVVMFGLVSIACYIDNDVRTRARVQVLNVIPDASSEVFEAVDERL